MIRGRRLPVLLAAALLALLAAGCAGTEPAPSPEAHLEQERENQAEAIAADEKAKADALADAQARQDKLAAEKAAEQAEQARELAAAKAEAEKLTAEKLAAEQAAAERIAAENAAAEAEKRRISEAAEKQRQAVAQAEQDAQKARAANAAAAAVFAKTPADAAPVNVQELTGLVAELTTGKGTLVLALRPDKAPRHVQNFVDLARKGFYDGLTFHSIVPGVKVQGGDPKGDGSGGPGYQIPAEFSDLRHLRGTLSMARASHPDTAGSQFFICLADDPRLDGQYTAFGRLVKGWETLDAIAAVGSIGGTPSETVTIQKILIRKGQPDELAQP